MTRRSYSGGARPARLSLALSPTDMAVSIEDASGWPTGANGPFFLTVNRGSANEEKILVRSRVGNNMAVEQRGADGTSPTSHAPDSFVEHVWTATDADESNAHVHTTGAAHGAGSALVGVDDAQTLTNKTIDAGRNTISGLTSAMIGGLSDEQAAQNAATALVAANLNAEAATRAQADATLANDIGAVAGNLNAEVANRQAADALLFRKAGGAISGPVTMAQGLTVLSGATSVPLPSQPGHAATKAYVDGEINKVVDVFFGTGPPPASGFKTGDVYLRHV